MRLLRIGLGVFLLLGGLYVLIGEHLAGVSADATVNARVNVVRAPIEGQVRLAVRSIGARVRSGELIAEIADERFDMARLLNLERDRDQQRVELQRLAAQRVALMEARAGFAAQLSVYQQGRIGQIVARIAETKASEEAAAARLREADTALKRADELSVRGAQTAANLDRARATYEVAQQELEGARQRTGYFAAELASARDGVFIGDSYNDAPFSAQRMREIDLRLAELASERRQIEERIAQFERLLQAERVRVNRLTSAALTARIDGLAWDFLVDDGEYARRGQDLVKLVDCNGLVVTASVTEALYDRLSIGAPAQFRLFGDERVFDATITRLGGAGASQLYANLAIGASTEHLTRFDVTLSVPALVQQPDLACAIGRTGRVVFAAGPVGLVRRFLARYGF
jgi:multidrug resistance efflux pump